MSENMGEIIKNLRIAKGITQEELGNVIGVKKAAIAKYEKGLVENIKRSSIKKLSDYFEVSPTYLMGLEQPKEPSNIGYVYDQSQIYPIPVFASVSAGFGAYADSEVLEYMPLPFDSETEAKESMVIIVHGDSMYPKIEDGDKIVVHKQESIDSGKIAVVLVDGDDGLVKRVVYDTDYIELQSINPMYPPQRFENEDVLRIRVVGQVKQIVRTVNQ